MRSYSSLALAVETLTFCSTRLPPSQLRYVSSNARRHLRANEFGDIQRSEVRLEKLVNPVDRNLRDFDMPAHRTKRVIPEVAVPVNTSQKKMRKLEEKQLFRQSIRGKRVLIECSRQEFNHVEGFEYPRGVHLPLATEFWDKNKYKNERIKIRPAFKNSAVSFDSRTWEGLVPKLLSASVASALSRQGHSQPTELQMQTILAFDSKRHLFIAAETGSGKTVAFGAPLLSRIKRARASGERVRGLVVTLTKQLRRQTFDVLSDLATGSSLCVKEALGVEDSRNSNSNDWDLLVSTPGLARPYLEALKDRNEVVEIVLDEADMLLDESFAADLTEIFALVPVANSETNFGSSRSDGARITFCSASCPEELECLAEGVVDSQHLSYVKSDHLHHVLPNIEIMFIRIREQDKISRLLDILSDDLKRGQQNLTMVFCKDSDTARFVHSTIRSSGIVASKFPTRSGENDGDNEQCQILVATDGASRGTDLPNLSHVINYDMARHRVDFLHRCGRVGRLGSRFPGRVTSFVRTPSEVKMTNAIELAVRLGRPLQDIEFDVAAMIRERKGRAPQSGLRDNAD